MFDGERARTAGEGYRTLRLQPAEWPNTHARAPTHTASHLCGTLGPPARTEERDAFYLSRGHLVHVRTARITALLTGTAVTASPTCRTRFGIIGPATRRTWSRQPGRARPVVKHAALSRKSTTSAERGKQTDPVPWGLSGLTRIERRYPRRPIARGRQQVRATRPARPSHP
jgi:hypothetical protein